MASCKGLVQEAGTQTESPSCCAAVLSQLQAVQRELFQTRRSLREALDSPAVASAATQTADSVLPASVAASSQPVESPTEDEALSWSVQIRLLHRDKGHMQLPCPPIAPQPSGRAMRPQPEPSRPSESAAGPSWPAVPVCVLDDDSDGEVTALDSTAVDTTHTAGRTVGEDSAPAAGQAGDDGIENEEMEVMALQTSENSRSVETLASDISASTLGVGRCSGSADELTAGSRAEDRPGSSGQMDATSWEYSCWQCLARFDSLRQMERHVAEKHLGSKPYRCSQCGEMFSNHSSFYLHLRTYHGVIALLSCKLCNRKFYQRASLLAHERIHGKKYVEQQQQKQQEQKHQQKPQAQEQKTKQQKQQQQKVKKTNKIQAQTQQLRRHTRSSHSQSGPQLRRSVCGHTANRPSHTSQCRFCTDHTQHKTFCCSMCSKRFTQKAQLQAHRRSHVGVSRANAAAKQTGATAALSFSNRRCPHCHRLFSRPDSALRHYRVTHLNIRPFSCLVCGTKTASKRDLQIHTVYCMKKQQKEQNKQQTQQSADTHLQKRSAGRQQAQKSPPGNADASRHQQRNADLLVGQKQSAVMSKAQGQNAETRLRQQSSNGTCLRQKLNAETCLQQQVNSDTSICQQQRVQRKIRAEKRLKQQQNGDVSQRQQPGAVTRLRQKKSAAGSLHQQQDADRNLPRQRSAGTPPVSELRRCPICRRLLSRSDSVHRHLWFVHQRKQPSSGCLLRAATQKINTGQRKSTWPCKHCTQVFTTCSSLSRHECIVHLKQKRFQCQTCGMRFAKTWHLRHHEYTHTHAQPYVCPECGCGFNQPGNLTMHRLRWHKLG